MIRRTALAVLAVTLVALLVLLLPVASFLADTERARLLTGMERDAFVLAGRSTEVLEHTSDVLAEPASLRSLGALVRGYHKTSGARVVVTDEAGVAVVTSDDADADVAVCYDEWPEIVQALDGEIATGTRWSDDLRADQLYVAVPVLNGQDVVGTVRLTVAADFVTAAVSSKVERLGVVALSGVVVGGLGAVVAARALTRQMRALTDLAQRYASGDLGARARTDRGSKELRSLAGSFNTMAARLADTLDRQRRFVADASHQLRTPLTALRLRLERARDLSVSADVAGRLAAAEAELDRLDATVEALLALCRAEGSPLTAEPLDVAAAARSRIAFWSALAAEHGVDLEYHGPTTATTSCAPVALEQIMDAYLDNALSVSPAGGTITLVVWEGGPVVEVHVLDEGPGLSADGRSRAFDRFWRARTDGTGTGLGLSIVAQLAHAVGAEVGLAPGPQGGLDAWVRLRAASPAAAPSRVLVPGPGTPAAMVSPAR